MYVHTNAYYAHTQMLIDVYTYESQRLLLNDAATQFRG